MRINYQRELRIKNIQSDFGMGGAALKSSTLSYFFEHTNVGAPNITVLDNSCAVDL